MASEQFNVGDVVQLKSGGQSMTIHGKDQKTGNWVCVWIGPAGPHEFGFPAHVLELVTNPGSSAKPHESAAP